MTDLKLNSFLTTIQEDNPNNLLLMEQITRNFTPTEIVEFIELVKKNPNSTQYQKDNIEFFSYWTTPNKKNRNN